MAELLPSSAQARYRSRFDEVAKAFIQAKADRSGKREFVVGRVERLAFTERKHGKRKRPQEMEPIDPDLLAELKAKEDKYKELQEKISELRESVPDLFEAARQETAKRAKTKETAPTTPAKSKQHPRAETPSKPDLYLEKLQKGAEKLKAVGQRFLEDQKNVEKIQVKEQRTRAAAEEPARRVVPNYGAPATPKPSNGSGNQRNRLASLLR